MSAGQHTAPLGLLLSDDMIFTSRITGTARDLGLGIKAATSIRELIAHATQQAPTCVIVDLANPSLGIRELIEQLRAACTQMPRVVAYGSHVDTAGLEEARDAGCDVVLPRSKFVQELPRAMLDWMRSQPQTSSPGSKGLARS